MNSYVLFSPPIKREPDHLIIDSYTMMRRPSTPQTSNRFNPYARYPSAPKPVIRSRAPIVHTLDYFNKVKIIQRAVRKYIIDVKKAAVNDTCAYSMGPIILRESVKIYDGNSLYLLNAELLAEYFMKNFKLMNPYTFRDLNNVEFMRMARHRKNIHMKPALDSSWRDREFLLQSLLERRNLISALSEDLENHVDGSLQDASRMTLEEGMDFLIEEFPHGMNQIVNDFVATDEYELAPVLRKILQDLRSGTRHSPVFVHLVRRQLCFVLSDFEHFY